MSKRYPPFIANYSSTSCQQASLAMIRAHFENITPRKKAMDYICAAQDDKWTRPFAPMINMFNKGYDVCYVGEFNIAAFARSPLKALKEFDGEENAKIAIEKSNIKQEKQNARDLTSLMQSGKIKSINKAPKEDDWRHFLKSGYLISQWVNSAALVGFDDEYLGHYVCLYSMTEDMVQFHNPGSHDKHGNPKNQNRGQTLSTKRFEQITRTPHTGKSEGFIALRPHRRPL